MKHGQQVAEVGVPPLSQKEARLQIAGFFAFLEPGRSGSEQTAPDQQHGMGGRSSVSLIEISMRPALPITKNLSENRAAGRRSGVSPLLRVSG